MTVVMVANNKGGVGKTTAVASLSAALARRKRRVLAIDMDAQANLTRRLGCDAYRPTSKLPTLAEALKADQPGCAIDIVARCGWDDPTAELIDLLPARADLENRVHETAIPGANHRLQTITEGMLGPYDFVLVDCPPSLGPLTQMAAVLTGTKQEKHGVGWVLIVTTPEFDPMDGAVKARDFVTQYAGRLGVPELAVRGVLINGVRTGLDLHTANIADIEAEFGDLVWTPRLPLWVALSEAMNNAVPVHSIGGQSAADLASRFDALAARLEQVS